MSSVVHLMTKDCLKIDEADDVAGVDGDDDVVAADGTSLMQL